MTFRSWIFIFVLFLRESLFYCLSLFLLWLSFDFLSVIDAKVLMIMLTDVNYLRVLMRRMFELKASIPLSKDLRIRVKDYDLLSANDAIGETTIDLENRYLSRIGALVGLPRTYCTSGACQWRDSRRPTQLLEEFCRNQLGTSPVYPNSTTVNIGQRVHKLADFGQRRCSGLYSRGVVGRGRGGRRPPTFFYRGRVPHSPHFFGLKFVLQLVTYWNAV